MLDILLSLVKDAGIATQPYLHVGNILANLDNLTKMCGTEYVKDKNAAIDAVIQILENHKS